MICNWLFWEKMWTLFLGIELAALFNLIDLNSAGFPCFEKVNLCPISWISPPRSLIKRQIFWEIQLSFHGHWRYFTCCSTESGRGLRKFPSSNVIGRPATEAQFQSGGHFKEVDRDRVEKACLPYFGQSEMNIWKVQLSCGQRGLLKCALVG